MTYYRDKARHSLERAERVRAQAEQYRESASALTGEPREICLRLAKEMDGTARRHEIVADVSMRQANALARVLA